jgi:hypothetical protein
MAEQTAKKSRTSTKTSTTKSANDEKNKDENLDLIKQMQKQIEQLQSQLAKAQSQPNVVVQSNSDITRTVKVVSMLPHTYVLSVKSNPKEKGRTYVFDKFGEVKNIRFSDMVEIVNNYNSQFEKGYAILTSQKDYEDLGVGYIYNEVMNKEAVERLISLVDDNAVDTILNMDKDTAERFVALIARKMSEGYNYDFNKIKELEKNGYDIDEMSNLISAK